MYTRLAESYHGVMLQEYITELYCVLIKWDYIIELDYRMRLRDYITESYSEMIIQN